MFHQHDSTCCHYLGSETIQTREYDFYYCEHHTLRSLDSVICRFGSEGSQYASYHPPEAFNNYILAHNQPYMTCMRLATEQRLYTGHYVDAFLRYQLER